MPYILDGRPISPDSPFTATNAAGEQIQFPANWIRLSSEEEKAAIGMTWQADPTPVDQRFYWDTGIPKDHGQLVEQWTQQTRVTAGTLLSPTDWMVIREADNGAVMDPAVKAERQAIRIAAGTKIQAIQATADTPALAAYITSAEYSNWGQQPPAEDPGAAVEEFVPFAGNSTSAGIG